jgi:acyl-CoA dehydrogenase
MALVLDDQQLAIQREAERIVAETSDTARLLALLEQRGAYDERLWQIARANGWVAIAAPEGVGGLGLGLSEVGIVCQALGKAPAGLPFVLTNYGVVQGLMISPDGDQGWLARIASGDAVGAVAFAEPFDPLPTKPAVMFDQGRLSGTKPAVTAGSAADCALVLASAGGAPVLALADLAGISRPALSTYDPARCHADLAFKDTPATILAQGPAALTIAREVLARMAVACAYEQLGAAEALLFIARDYAKTRKAFGQPIGAFQAVKHRIAELYGLVEIARANCAAAAEAEGQPGFHAAAASARLAATEAYDTAARDCVQIHGGIGVTWELGLHLHMRRARSLASELGNALFWEDWLVDELTGAAP